MKPVEEKTPHLRPARRTEAQALSALALRSKAYWGYSAEFIAACRDELSFTADQIESDNFHFEVCQLQNQRVGFYAIERLGDHRFELSDLFVEPEFIGQGYGRLLIGNAKQKARELGARKLVIQSDPNAERFYTAAGGVITGQRESGSVPGRFLPLFQIDLI